MTLIQFVILASACVAIGIIVMAPQRSHGTRVGCWVGLIGQPFWLYETMRADQFGMFAVSLWFTGVYLAGALRRPAPSQPNP